MGAWLRGGGGGFVGRKAFDIRRMACVIGGTDGTNAAKNDAIELHFRNCHIGGYCAGVLCGRAGGVVAESGGGAVLGWMGDESAREDD